MTYLVIGICVFLLITVIIIAAKPISMGIEARRNIKEEIKNEDDYQNEESLDETSDGKISDEILKLNKLKNDGILTEEEYKKAKDKLLS